MPLKPLAIMMLLCLFAGAGGLMPPSFARAEATIRAEMNGLTLTFDAQTGGLVGLSYPATGEMLNASPEIASLLTASFPTKDFVPMQLEPRRSKAKVQKTENEVTITWDALGANRPSLGLPSGQVSARVTVRPAPDGRSVIMSARVENHSQGQVNQILFPDLAGLHPIDDPGRVELRMALGVVNPFAGPPRPADRSPFYPSALWQQYPAEPMYQMNALRWMDLGSLKGGLSIYQRKWLEEPRAGILTHRYEADPRSLRLAWQHAATVDPGKAWESGEFWLTPHAGGWAKGIEPYRAYVQSVNPPRDTPETAVPKRIKEGLGFQTLWMIQTTEKDPNHAAFKFKDLPRVARDAKAHGIDEIMLWNWCAYGDLPPKPRPELGPVEDMLKAIADAKKIGVNIAAFCNMKNLDDKFAARYGVRPGNAASWTYHPELIPSMFPFTAPSGQIDIETTNKIWQKDMLDAFRLWIGRGITSYGWDVFQDYGSMDLVNGIKEVRKMTKAKDPESSFCGEPVLSNLERQTQILDYSWNWLDYIEAGPYLNVLRYPRVNCNIERSARVVKMAFADGLYMNLMPKQPELPNGSKTIGEEPELAAALKTVAPLRRQFLPYFVEGVMIGDSVLAKPVCEFTRTNKSGEIGGATFKAPPFEYPEIYVCAHQLPGRLLIIVLNNAAAPRTVELESDLAMWLPKDKGYEVKTMDEQGKVLHTAEAAAGRWQGKTASLKPLELAFFEITIR